VSKSNAWILMVIIVAATVVAGCEHKSQPTSPASAAPVFDPSMDTWLGQWKGPEGAYLALSKNGEGFCRD